MTPTMTRAEIEARLRPDDPAYVRKARKAYRCRAAEPILGWRVHTTSVATAASTTWPEGKQMGEGWRGTYPDEAEARALAESLIGTRSNTNMDTGEVTGVYAAAEARPIENRFHDPDGGCLGDIEPGDLYIEDRNDALMYESGMRFCLPCGLRQWERT